MVVTAIPTPGGTVSNIELRMRKEMRNLKLDMISVEEEDITVVGYDRDRPKHVIRGSETWSAKATRTVDKGRLRRIT